MARRSLAEVLRPRRIRRRCAGLCANIASLIPELSRRSLYHAPVASSTDHGTCHGTWPSAHYVENWNGKDKTANKESGMGVLVDGVWQDRWYDTKSTGGRFVRKESRFRNWVTPDGSPGPSGEGGFKAEPGRYHLYISRACPWAHRAAIFRALKGLEDMISLSITHWLMADEGWTFNEAPGTIPDTVNGAKRLYEVYVKADAGYSGRATVPVLWDKQQATIVSNESAEIIGMLNSAFDGVGARREIDFCPADLREQIDEINAVVYDNVNNGVYRCGFASTQDAYDEAFEPLFATLDMLDARLSKQRYLLGERLTEADWRLFTTLVRFDPVYFGHFKCNLRRISDYPNLSNYVRDLFQVPGVAATVNIQHIKNHYYQSHTKINPTGIVPVGPELDYAAPHDRDRVKSREDVSAYQ
jgi:putative glutathione S-transferase